MSRPCPDKPLKKDANGSPSASPGRSALETRADKPPVPPCRPAFTLIEMMVTITILLVLTGITVAVVNVSLDQDRISDSGRTVQAFLEGARDRAIHAGQPRGVRFLLDPSDPNGKTVASMVYIGAPELYSEGRVWVDTTDKRMLHGVIAPGTSTATGWVGLSTRNRLVGGARIRITASGSSNWYTVDLPSNPLTLEILTLTRDFQGTLPTALSPAEYLLELAPAVLPNQQPRPLARGIVIDLNQSRLNNRLPTSWYDGAAMTYRPRMDILFSPRGTVTGPLAGQGVIHLVLDDVADVEQGFLVGQLKMGTSPNEILRKGNELILTVTTQTGNISTHHVDTSDQVDNTTKMAPPDGIADDPFRFAELGEAAK